MQVDALQRSAASWDITDGKALLRYALPIDNQAVRKLQASLEDIATHRASTLVRFPAI